jgi:hypothetical protein
MPHCLPGQQVLINTHEPQAVGWRRASVCGAHSAFCRCLQGSGLLLIILLLWQNLQLISGEHPLFDCVSLLCLLLSCRHIIGYKALCSLTPSKRAACGRWALVLEFAKVGELSGTADNLMNTARAVLVCVNAVCSNAICSGLSIAVVHASPLCADQHLAGLPANSSSSLTQHDSATNTAPPCTPPSIRVAP